MVANGKDAEVIAHQVASWFNDERLIIKTTAFCGLTFSLNLGIHYARGKYIARMDADDISKLDRLSFQVAHMILNPSISILGTNYEIINSDGRIIGEKRMPSSNQKIRTDLMFHNVICHPSVIFRKDLLAKYGGYQGGLHAEDYDLWCRMALDPEIHFENLGVSFLQYRESSTGAARRSIQAYSTVAAGQFRNFIICWDFRWMIGCIITIFKKCIKSSR